MKRLVLADFSWLCYRYYFTPMNKSMSVVLNGEQICTGIFYGFGQLLASMFKCNTDTEVLFCLDADHEDLHNSDIHQVEGVAIGYKEGRERHPEVWERMDEIMAICACSRRVGFAKSERREADDVMAMLYFELRDSFDQVVIYSGDNDLLQLIPYGAKVSRKMDKGDFLFIGEQYLEEKFPGVPVEHLIKYRIIVGDPSDNIPPVVPRLDRRFVKAFVARWHAVGWKQAVEEFKHDPKMEKVLANIAALKRNAMLMDLTKYVDPTNRMFEVSGQLKALTEIFKVQPRQELIELYRMNSYKEFLELHARVLSYVDKSEADRKANNGGEILVGAPSSGVELPNGYGQDSNPNISNIPANQG